ncbi:MULTISPECIES: hypothetical protein [Streptomyces]|uniref:hypothetical protein n=1 Tax=Streptomyces TaxID=1883 RepID=UPI001E3F2B13|nr:MULTISPECIES: hypothetical protein [Streptomyces]UFQ16869.1 hypothetical protein J2N69_18730 [Streptomyces huasconensis]WCL86472.1 hypothetical protein PPN52_18735 [Streptomyces sp. JCM 35825]
MTYPKHAALSQTVEVTARTILPGDVLNIGGQAFEVLNLIELPAQGKALRFTTGEVLNMHFKTRLTVFRTARRW